ncbi:MAG: hypothetical protein M0C28_17155 [Candidatus Moduliflexus flocculans]|nr:hypothetical protein [Candidatus Moduliflexus flocculans]
MARSARTKYRGPVIGVIEEQRQDDDEGAHRLDSRQGDESPPKTSGKP